jgi:hypothetical protein
MSRSFPRSLDAAVQALGRPIALDATMHTSARALFQQMQTPALANHSLSSNSPKSVMHVLKDVRPDMYGR